MKFSQFSILFQYPNDKSIAQILNMNSTASDFLKFKNFVKNSSIEGLQEKYTQTFDMNPATSLDLGWHLYGEAYERGAFLVKLRTFMRTGNIRESSELPDHITHIFKIMDLLNELEQDGFLKEYTVPALNKIIDGFEGSENPYRFLIEFVLNEINKNKECLEDVNGNL